MRLSVSPTLIADPSSDAHQGPHVPILDRYVESDSGRHDLLMVTSGLARRRGVRLGAEASAETDSIVGVETQLRCPAEPPTSRKRGEIPCESPDTRGRG